MNFENNRAYSSTNAALHQWEALEGYSLSPDELTKPHHAMPFRDQLGAFFGVQGDHLLDQGYFASLSKKLNLDPKVTDSLSSLKERRIFAKALATLSTTSFLAALASTSQGDNETAIPLFVASSALQLGAYFEASQRDRVVELALTAFQDKLAATNLGEHTTKSLRTAFDTAIKTLGAQERQTLLGRPMEMIVNNALEAVVIAAGNPEAAMWLTAGIIIMVVHDQYVVKQKYKPAQEKYLQAKQGLGNGRKTFAEAAKEAWEPALLTIPINAVPFTLRVIGYLMAARGGGVGVMAALMSTLSRTSSGIVTSRREITDAQLAHHNLVEVIDKLVLPELAQMIQNPDDLRLHQEARSASEHPPLAALTALFAHCKQAMSFDISFTHPRTHKEVACRAAIDFDDGRAFHLFGPNGRGKSIFAHALLDRSKGHLGNACLKDKQGQLIDLHNLSWGQQQAVVGLFDAGQLHTMHRYFPGKFTFCERTGLQQDQAVSLLKTLKLEHFANMIEVDLSGQKLSQGEQLILNTVAYLESSRSAGLSLVVIDEPLDKIDPHNASKLLQIFDYYTSQGLAVVTLSQDPDKFPTSSTPTKGAYFQQDGFAYFDANLIRHARKLQVEERDTLRMHKYLLPSALIESMGGVQLIPNTSSRGKQIYANLLADPQTAKEHIAAYPFLMVDSSLYYAAEGVDIVWGSPNAELAILSIIADKWKSRPAPVEPAQRLAYFRELQSDLSLLQAYLLGIMQLNGERAADVMAVAICNNLNDCLPNWRLPYIVQDSSSGHYREYDTTLAHLAEIDIRGGINHEYALVSDDHTIRFIDNRYQRYAE